MSPSHSAARRNPPVRVALVVLACFALPAAAVPLAAQAGGAVSGHVRDADGAGVPLALVVLAPADSTVPRRSSLTDRAGSFRFVDVPPGSYRLLLERIGYERQSSAALQVQAGATVTHEFAGRARAVTMAPIVARVAASGDRDGTCFTVGQLWRDSALATVWNEATKGVETRRAFDRQYPYALELRQSVTATPVRGTRLVRDSSFRVLVNDPARAEEDEQARREQRHRQGFGYTFGNVLTLDLPDEKELLDADFLTRHCLEAGVEEQDGAWQVRFRPVKPERGRIDVVGTIRLDTATFQVRSITYQYVRGRNVFIMAAVTYGDVPFFPGTELRVPLRGEFHGRPIGPVGASIRTVDGTITFSNYVT
ncbi:MAG: Carboxypeptidase regulatory-like protein [Gemmatimonadetes bacterium]|nr:Carboxypeptidase regulatory-like protein [Gemmatimonadota bacterium]